MKAFSKKSILILLALWMVFPIVSGCNSQSPDSPSPVSARRILFIGDSYTGINSGLDKHLSGLAPDVIAARLSVTGATLENHWRNTETLNVIRTGQWDVVVLQEHSQTPVVNPKNFLEYAGRLHDEIKKTGARTILLMTWERPDSVQYRVTTANLSAIVAEVGQQIDAGVAPVGVAFFRALQARPELKLYSFDGHPTLSGTYLAACVCYGMIFEKSPAGNVYAAGLNDADRIFFQKIAAQVMGL